jgi:hypothetical protein
MNGLRALVDHHRRLDELLLFADVLLLVAGGCAGAGEAANESAVCQG